MYDLLWFNIIPFIVFRHPTLLWRHAGGGGLGVSKAIFKNDNFKLTSLYLQGFFRLPGALQR